MSETFESERRIIICVWEGAFHVWSGGDGNYEVGDSFLIHGERKLGIDSVLAGLETSLCLRGLCVVVPSDSL